MCIQIIVISCASLPSCLLQNPCPSTLLNVTPPPLHSQLQWYPMQSKGNVNSHSNHPCPAPAPALPAAVVSDAAAGGQILVCRTTFDAVKDLAQELGCVDANGVNYSKLHAQNSIPWTRLWR